MQKKIFVGEMFDDESAAKVCEAVKAVQGVTNVKADPARAQVLVDFEDGSIEEAINTAITSAGAVVL